MTSPYALNLGAFVEFYESSYQFLGRRGQFLEFPRQFQDNSKKT